MTIAYAAGKDTVATDEPKYFLVMNQPRGYFPWFDTFAILIIPVSILLIVSLYVHAWKTDMEEQKRDLEHSIEGPVNDALEVYCCKNAVKALCL